MKLSVILMAATTLFIPTESFFIQDEVRQLLQNPGSNSIWQLLSNPPPAASSKNNLTKVLKKKKQQSPIIRPDIVLRQKTPAGPIINHRKSYADNFFRQSRFFSLFTVVKFKNEVCNSGMGSNGTCYSPEDCQERGGQASGSCASGFGVCCLCCGHTSSHNCTYFHSTNYPGTFTTHGSCQLTIIKASSVCQLRLDFDNFVLEQPDVESVCLNDQFIVSGCSPIPVICGINTGHHIYVDTGIEEKNPTVLTMVTGGSTSFKRSFSIKITQIDCSATVKASDGCLQYFVGVSGTLTSFNYNNFNGSMLSNTDYTICIRTERDFCGIQYAVCFDDHSPENYTDIVIVGDGAPERNTSFSVSGSYRGVGSVVDADCYSDWINIPCATNTKDPHNQKGLPLTCVDRICGMVFNSVASSSNSYSVQVNSFVRPFTVHVHTDALESSYGDQMNKGFCLRYLQLPCSAAIG